MRTCGQAGDDLLSSTPALGRSGRSYPCSPHVRLNERLAQVGNGAITRRDSVKAQDQIERRSEVFALIAKIGINAALHQRRKRCFHRPARSKGKTVSFSASVPSRRRQSNSLRPRRHSLHSVSLFSYFFLISRCADHNNPVAFLDSSRRNAYTLAPTREFSHLSSTTLMPAFCRSVARLRSTQRSCSLSPHA